MRDAVPGRYEVDSLGVGCRSKCTVQARDEAAECSGFSLCHVREVHKVATRHDLHSARGRGLWLAVLDEIMMLLRDPAADRGGMARSLKLAVRAVRFRRERGHAAKRRRSPNPRAVLRGRRHRSVSPGQVRAVSVALAWRQMATLIFVHGACVTDHGWWWEKMSEPLAAHGIATVTVPLPSCGETVSTLGDLYADVDSCRQVIDETEGPIVLCGHSYGGMVITDAGAHTRVTQLIYLTSVMADTGQSQAQLTSSEPAPWLQPGDDGTIGVDPEMIEKFFLQDCDAETSAQALARLTRQSLVPFTQAPREIAWQQKPATYIVCTDDLATPAQIQRQRVKESTRVIEFQAGHHPFLSRPEAFADTLAAEINRS